jgi:3'(2'), 5'-bisphosphate nucleotidase
MVVASKRHGDPERLEEFLKGWKVAGLVNRSSSLKFCVLAAGEADLYPRLGPTSEWDTAAGDAILRAAGGTVRTLEGAPLRYGKTDKKFLNPEFVARAA